MVVVVVTGLVVDVMVCVVVWVVEVTVVVVTVLEVVVVFEHGQFSRTSCPVADIRQISASVATIGSVPPGAQTHSGLQLTEPEAALSMKRQSVAVGWVPLDFGRAHCADQAEPAHSAR